jgi:hypothetical protein
LPAFASNDATRCLTLSAAGPWAAEFHAAGAWPGCELGLDALVAEATQDPVEQGLVDGADDLGGAAGQGVEGAVPQPQVVLVPPFGLVAELLEQLTRGGEGTLGPQPPEPSPLPDVGAELGPPGGADLPLRPRPRGLPDQPEASTGTVSNAIPW